MKLAIFDFDGTLLRVDTLPALGDEWLSQKRSRAKYIYTYLMIFPSLAFYRMGWLSRERFKFLAVYKFNRLFSRMVQEDVEAFMESTYEGLAGFFNQAVLDELKGLQAQGYYCILLSGAYKTLLQTVAERLGIDMVLGTELIYRNGVFAHRIRPDIIDGKGKVKLLKKSIPWNTVDWQASRSYGDSYSDRFIMEIVGQPVAVNPDPELLDYAQQRNWRIIQG